MDPNKSAFGCSTVKGDSAGSIVSPDKSSAEIERESEEGRELYRKSHNAWDVGEMVDRGYNWSVFTKDSLYGVPTPHENSGRQVKEAMHWLCDAQRSEVNMQKLEKTNACPVLVSYPGLIFTRLVPPLSASLLCPPPPLVPRRLPLSPRDLMTSGNALSLSLLKSMTRELP